MSFHNSGSGFFNASNGQAAQYNNNVAGSQHNHYYGYPSGSDEERKRLQCEKDECLQSLSFPSMFARRDDVVDAHPNTGSWILETTAFREWRDATDHSGVLWIKGHPGTGKSTLMKIIWEYCKSAFQDRTTIAYFFHARGDSLEKTPLGMLRSLLCELLKMEETTYQRFLPLFREKKGYHQKLEWREPELKKFLCDDMKFRKQPLVILIDALDECSDSQARGVVDFLERLSGINCMREGVNISICLSSRKYPTVTMQKSQELAIEHIKEHKSDIATYVHDKLKKSDPGIENEVLKKASGIFMWVVLVVAMLNKAYDEGKVEAMEQKLREVPGDLDELFLNILSTGDSDKNETILMLQWVLFAVRPLGPGDLYYATLAGINVTNLPPWDGSQLITDAIKRRIIHSSRGLIEVSNKGKTVQFIHESVTDFLRQNKYQRLQNLDPMIGTNPVGLSHDRLKTCCVSFIREYTPIHVFMDVFSRDKMLLYPPADPSHSLRDHPFLEYAAYHWIDHAEAAEAGNVPQTEFLKGIKGDHGMKRLLVAHTTFCYHYIYASGYGDDLDLLNIFVAHEHKKIARLLVQHGSDIIPQGWNYISALYMSVWNCDAESVRFFLDYGTDPNSWYKGCTVFQWALKPVKMYFNAGIEIIRLLLDYGADVNAISQESSGKSVLYLVLKCHGTPEVVDILKLMLDHKVDVNARYGEKGNNALHDAASFCAEEEIVRHLLDSGADVRAVGGEYGTALQAAAYLGNVMVADLLLERGADIDAQGGAFGSALQAAAWSNNRATTQLLIERGAKVNTQGGLYGNALQAAATAPFMWGFDDPKDMDVVRLLLEHRVDVNAQGGMYGSALQAAVSEGREDIAILLLDHGAVINAQADKDPLALRDATLSTRRLRGMHVFDDRKTVPDITQMFPDNSAYICTWKGKYGHALQMAVLREETRLATLLLKHGADVNYRTERLGPPLILAASKNNTELAMLLLDHGADVNGECGPFGNALQWTICLANTSMEMVALILRGKYGADVHRVCGPYGTALKAAVAFGRYDIEMLLRQHGAVM